MTFKVVLLPMAEQDVDEILTWIHRKSPAGALAWRSAWLKTIQHLEQSADCGSEAPESELHPLMIQHQIFRTRRGKPYRIFGLFEATRPTSCMSAALDKTW